MALKGKSNTAATQNYEKADAFLNLVLIDSEGNEFRLGKGLPLYMKDALSKALIENADKSFRFKGTVQLATQDKETPVPIFA